MQWLALTMVELRQALVFTSFVFINWPLLTYLDMDLTPFYTEDIIVVMIPGPPSERLLCGL